MPLFKQVNYYISSPYIVTSATVAEALADASCSMFRCCRTSCCYLCARVAVSTICAVTSVVVSLLRQRVLLHLGVCSVFAALDPATSVGVSLLRQCMLLYLGVCSVFAALDPATSVISRLFAVGLALVAYEAATSVLVSLLSLLERQSSADCIHCCCTWFVLL